MIGMRPGGVISGHHPDHGACRLPHFSRPGAWQPAAKRLGAWQPTGRARTAARSRMPRASFHSLALSLSPSLPLSLSPSLPLSLPPSLPPSLPRSLAPSLPPSLPPSWRAGATHSGRRHREPAPAREKATACARSSPLSRPGLRRRARQPTLGRCPRARAACWPAGHGVHGHGPSHNPRPLAR